jgi:hypothetical protein
MIDIYYKPDEFDYDSSYAKIHSFYSHPKYRSTQMPYDFSQLSQEDAILEKDRVIKELQRQLYGAILRLGENPETYETSAHVVPEDPEEVGYVLKLEVARLLSQLEFVASI